MRRPLAAVAASAPRRSPHASRRPRRPRPRCGIGIFDDGMVLYGEPDRVFPQLANTGAQPRARQPLVVGPGHPRRDAQAARPADPSDPAYNWDTYDRTVRFSIVNGMQPIFSIIGTPPWANAAKGWNVAPTNVQDLRQLRDRRAAALQRRVRRTPTASRCLGSASGWRGTSRTTPSSSSRSTGAAGRRGRSSRDATTRRCATRSSRGSSPCSGPRRSRAAQRLRAGTTTRTRAVRPSRRSRSSRAMKAGGATGFDAYAHHPYYGAPAETPTTPPPLGARGQPSDGRHARQHRHARRRAQPPLRKADAALDHGVRLPDEPARPYCRCHLEQAGAVSDAGDELRAEAPADRHLPLVPPPRRGSARRLAVGPDHRHRPAEAELQRVPARGPLGYRLRGMAKGYAEGPAAEEAERRREELARGRHGVVDADARRGRGMHGGRPRAALPRMGRRGRPRRAVRLRRGLGHPVVRRPA